MRKFVIIPAGGKGLRSGYAAPKQFLKFAGKELIVYTLETFQRNRLVDEIIICVNKSYFNLIEKLKSKYVLNKITVIVEGGKERQDSVYNGLKSIKAGNNDLVIVHDAARPMLPDKVLTNAILTAQKKGNALVCIKASDTLIKGKSFVDSYLDRNDVYFVQTPQIFKYKDLIAGMSNAYKNNFYGTDESMLVKKIGKKINIVNGSLLNFKITSKEDIVLFKQLLKQNK